MATSRGESERHRDLKRRTLLWAQANGFSACALEVRVPRSGFRADVVAGAVSPSGTEVGEVAIFECKQERSDLLRDTADERKTLAQLQEVSTRRSELEHMLGLHLPDLRRGDSLFAEYDQYDLESIRHDGLRSVRREEARLRSRLYGATKFDRLFRYRCADRHYLVVAEGVIEPHEAPSAWGVLVASGDGLEVRRLPEKVEINPSARLALLHAIAVAGTRRLNAELGIDWEAVEAARGRILPGVRD